jgi:hypothetical protein
LLDLERCHSMTAVVYSENMLSTALDPDGRRVYLTEERWTHIRDEHANLASKLREIMAAVREPAVSMPGRSADEVWFLAEDAGRFPWLQVVVHYEEGEGWIVTAFPRSALPRR